MKSKWDEGLLNSQVDRDKIIYSDESKFTIFKCNGRAIVWRKPGEELELNCLLPTFKNSRNSVMVWACFSSFGVGKLVFIEDIMYKEDYFQIFK